MKVPLGEKMRKIAQFITCILLLSIAQRALAQTTAPCTGVTRIRFDASDLNARQNLEQILRNHQTYTSNGRYEFCFTVVRGPLRLTQQQIPITIGNTPPPLNQDIVISGLNLECTNCSAGQPLLVVNYQGGKVILENVDLNEGGLLLQGSPNHEIRGGSITGSRAPNSYGIRIESDDAVISGTRISGFDRGIAIVGLMARIGNQCEVTNNSVGVHVQRQNLKTQIQQCSVYDNSDGDTATIDSLRIDGDTRTLRFWEVNATAREEVLAGNDGVIRFRGNGVPTISLPESTITPVLSSNRPDVTIVAAQAITDTRVQRLGIQGAPFDSSFTIVQSSSPSLGTATPRPIKQIEFFGADCGRQNLRASRNQICLLPNISPLTLPADGTPTPLTVPQEYSNQSLVAIYTDENGSTPISSVFNIPFFATRSYIVMIGIGPQPITLTTPGATGGGDSGGASIGGDSSGSTVDSGAIGDAGTAVVASAGEAGDGASGGVISAADVSTGTRPDIGAPMFEEAIPNDAKEKEKEKEKAEADGTIASNDGNRAGLTGGAGVGPGGGCEQSLLPPPSNRTVVLWLGLWWIITSIGLLLIARPIYQHIAARRHQKRR